MQRMQFFLLTWLEEEEKEFNKILLHMQKKNDL